MSRMQMNSESSKTSGDGISPAMILQKMQSFISLHPLDVGSERLKLRLHRLVAPVQVIDAVHPSLAFRAEAAQDEARARAKIGRHERRAVQALLAANQRRVSADRDIGAEANELGDVHEAV